MRKRVSEQVGMEQDGSMTHNLSLQCGLFVGGCDRAWVGGGYSPSAAVVYSSILQPSAAFPAKWKSNKSALAILRQSVSGGGE